MSLSKKPYVPHFNLTEEQFNRFKSGCNTTLSYVAEGLSPRASQKEVIETVLDADRVATFGCSERSQAARQEWSLFYETTIRPLFKHYSTPAFSKMMKEIFPKGSF